MRRLPIQLDEETYEALKQRAFEEGRSIAAVIRESVSKMMSPARRLSLADFPFVASGDSRQRSDRPVSERHDEALAEVLPSKTRR